MWPKKNTAFVVIHGAGSHRPFAALDKFVRGFTTVLERSNTDLGDWWEHRLRRREDWIEHYISLAPEGRPKLDFYEYYWDNYMDHQVELSEVIQWIDQISTSAKRFYREHPNLSQQYSGAGTGLFDRDGEFKVGGYFILFGWVGRFLRVLQRLGIARIPILSTLITWLLSRAARFMSDMMGDVVIYSTADVRSVNYAIRQRLLAGAVDELKMLLKDDDYEQIIVAGHSLGSVIAYDALNRIIMDVNTVGGVSHKQAQKIAGLVTFGSPLDKVAFFFREQTGEGEFVREQILMHLHGFKGLPADGRDQIVSIDNPVESSLDRAQWLNFYHLNDPVSGSLDAYAVDHNIRSDVPAKRSSDAHAAYWTDDKMFEKIGAAFFKSTLDAFLSV